MDYVSMKFLINSLKAGERNNSYTGKKELSQSRPVKDLRTGTFLSIKSRGELLRHKSVFTVFNSAVRVESPHISIASSTTPN